MLKHLQQHDLTYTSEMATSEMATSEMATNEMATSEMATNEQFKLVVCKLRCGK